MGKAWCWQRRFSARLESGGGLLRRKWIVRTLEPQLYQPRVLCIGGPSSSFPCPSAGGGCGSFRTGIQLAQEEVRLQIFLWHLF